MQVARNTYLKFVPFQDFNLWDVKVYKSKKLKPKFSLAKLNNFLSADKMEWVEIEDEKEYPILGVRGNGKGVYINRVAKGSELTMKKYQKSKVNYLFYCKVRTVNGQWGIVYPEFENSYGSSNMQYLEVDESKINLRFFELLLSIKSLTTEFDKNAIGADGRHFTLKTLLSLEIPLPSLSEQEILVKNYFNKIEEAEKLSKQANDLENEIEQYLFKELGIEKETNAKEHSTFRIVQYRDIDRWDGKKDYEFNSKFDVEKIGKYITSMSTGTTPPTSRKEYFDGGNINFYAPSDLGLSMYLSKAERKVTELAIEDKKARVFKKGTLLFVGIGSTVGKIGIVANKFATSNQQITGFTVNQEFLLNEYTYYFFNSFKEITTKEQTKATLPIVNQDKIQNIPIPIPPISKQHEIVKHIQELKEKIIEQKTQAEQLKHRAEQEFEQAIFS